MKFDAIKLNQAIGDCLTEMGHPDAGHVVLIVANKTLGVGTNINDAEKVSAMLLQALRMIDSQIEAIAECKGSA